MRPRKKKVLSVASLVIADWVCQYLGYKFGFGLMNRGLSFGMFPGVSFLVVLLVWLVLVLKNKSGEFDLLVVGGLGNLIPRFLFGGVWDYIPYYFFWGNLSDVLIVFGVIEYTLGYGNRDSLRGREQTGN